MTPREDLTTPSGDASYAAVDATTAPGDATHSTSAGGGLGALGLLTVLLCSFLAVVDFFVVNVALPSIGNDLHASAATLQLVVAGYGISYALLLVLGGRLGDHLGRRRVLLVGLVVFTVLRLVCGLAPTAGTLVAARIAQGAAAALLVPQLLGTLQATLTGARRVRAIGAFGAMNGLSMVVGQVLGGVIVTADIAGTGWRPIFLVLVPLNVLVIVLVRRSLPETRAARTAALDGWGAVLLGAALFALLVPLTEGRALGWPAWTWALLAAAPVFATAFVVTQYRGERRGGSPLVPPSLVRTRSMRVGLVLAVPFFAGFGGLMFVFPVAVQQGAGLAPFEAGLALAPYALAFLVVSLYVDRVIDRFGRRVLVVGALVVGVGYVAMGLTAWWAWPDVGVLTLAMPGIVAGVGQAGVMAPLFRIVLAEVPADRAGTGSGVLTTTQQTSLALGVATLATLFLVLVPLPQLGMRGAFLVLMLAELAVSGLVAGIATRLPDVRVGQRR